VDLFVVRKGKRIAKRGKPGTVHAKQWVSLEPGVEVRDLKNSLEIVYYEHGSVLQ
jgi:hypothetical protein